MQLLHLDDAPKDSDTSSGNTFISMSDFKSVYNKLVQVGTLYLPTYLPTFLPMCLTYFVSVFWVVKILPISGQVPTAQWIRLEISTCSLRFESSGQSNIAPSIVIYAPRVVDLNNLLVCTTLQS